MYKRLFRILSCLLVSGLSCLPFGAPVLATTIPALPPKLVISELQTGGVNLAGNEDGRLEFIELYNAAEESLDVTGWRVEYLSASHNGTGAPTRVLATLKGSVFPKGHVLVGHLAFDPDSDVTFGEGSLATSGLLAKSGGHARIVDVLGLTVDLVGWGSGVRIGDWWRGMEVPAGQSIQRILPEDSEYTTGLIFHPPSLVTSPEGRGLYVPELPSRECELLQINEIFANPQGVDSGKEFIELYNPAETSLSLQGCSLRLGEAGRVFFLPEEVLGAKMYRAFSDVETGIVLPNSAAQTVWLLTPTKEQGVLYPNDMPDDLTWSFIEGEWQYAEPTPGSDNRALIIADEEGDGPDYPQPVPCAIGKERNPISGRCRSVDQTPEDICHTGYERNSITGRCRKNVAPAVVNPCKEGQERNPETNRCRSVLAVTAEQKPCPEGQERNPETNRCKKISSSATSDVAAVQDVRSIQRSLDARWWIAGVLVAGAIGYAGYEWRHEIQRSAAALRHRWREWSGRPH